MHLIRSVRFFCIAAFRYRIAHRCAASTKLQAQSSQIVSSFAEVVFYTAVLLFTHIDTADDAIGHQPCDGDKYPAGSPCFFTKQHSQADIENGSTAKGDIIQPGIAVSMLFLRYVSLSTSSSYVSIEQPA